MKWIPAIYAATIVLIALMVPVYFAKVVEPRNIRQIKRHCEDLGLTDISIVPYPNHYGVTFRKEGNKKYLKCRVIRRKIEWKGFSPEEC